MHVLGKISFDQVIRKEDIYWWNNCLNNRIGKLSETFVYVETHFERLQKNTLPQKTEEFLFEYYSEIFFYYFFSTRDILAQLLNLLFNLGFESNKIYFNDKFINRILDKDIQEDLRIFLRNTSESYNIRNAFNHRFTPNQKDNRASTNIIKKDNIINVYTPEEPDKSEIFNEIKHLQKSLADLMSYLSIKIK